MAARLDIHRQLADGNDTVIQSVATRIQHAAEALTLAAASHTFDVMGETINRLARAVADLDQAWATRLGNEAAIHNMKEDSK